MDLWIISSLLAVVAKSGYQIWQKILTESYSSVSISQAAFGVSFVIFSFATAAQSPDLSFGRGLLLAAVAGILLSLGLLSYVKSLETTDLSVASPLQQTIPIFVTILEPVFVMEATYDITILLAAIVTVLGAYVVNSNGESPSQPIRKMTSKGPLLALLTALLFGASAVVARLSSGEIAVTTFLLIQSGVGFVVLSLYNRDLPPRKAELGFYGFVFSMNSGISYLTITLVAASKATILFRLSVVVNVIVGFLLFREEGILYRSAGSALILLGIVIVISS